MRKIIHSNWLYLFIALLISIPLILPYFRSGYFPTHDGEWAVVRLADMFRTIKDFQLPVRYSGALNFGYGYPLFNFAYPFPYYLGILFYIPLHSFIVSIKTLFALSVVMSSIFMYLCSYELWKNRTAAIVSSFIYIYLPYRLVDLYVRGNIGESMSFSLFPLIFYLSIKLFASPFSRKVVFLLSVTISMLVMTHNIMTVLFLPALFLFILVRILLEKRIDVLKSFLLCIFLGAGMSSFFWFPALYEKGNILLSKIPIADRSIYFVNLRQLTIPSWGYAPPTQNGGFSYQLGIPQIISVLLSIAVLTYSLFQSKFKLTPLKIYASLLMILYFLYFLMLFKFTSIIWKSIPLVSEINYPWTILSQLGFITALLAGFIVIQSKYLKYTAFLLVIISIVLTFPYARPERFNNYQDSYYMTNEATTTSSDELMPLWVKERPNEHYKDKVEIVSGNAQIKNIDYNSRKVKFNYSASEDAVFRINTIYYPGWNAYVNNEKVKINYENKQGVIEINASRYRNSVSLFFEETFTRLIADIVSVLFFVAAIFILIRPILLFKSNND